MYHYKSWSGLNKQLCECLCESLKGRITYFLTRYHTVHNAYGRASIRLDGEELVCFSWIERYRQESDLHEEWEKSGIWDYDDPKLKEKWDSNTTYCDMNFLAAAAEFVNMPIKSALESENCIIKIFAILDRRVGKRTLRSIAESQCCKHFPPWVRQFYELRLSNQVSGKV